MKLANKKVKNATVIEIDGIKFRSKIEAYTYKRLMEEEIPFEYEKERYELLPKFEFQGESIRAMTYKPDFTGPGYIIEVKGHETDAWKIRKKLVAWKILNDLPHTTFYTVKSQRQVNEVINKIKQNYEEQSAVAA